MHLEFEKNLFHQIKQSCLSSHIGDVDYDVCNGISLLYLRYILDRKAALKTMGKGVSHLIREAIVEFGVRVTHELEKWKHGSDMIRALKSKTTTKYGSVTDELFCKRILTKHPVDVFDTFGFVSDKCSVR